MNIVELCAGIGSFSVAAKRVNNILGHQFYTTVGCSEIDTFCNRVLEREGHEITGDLGLLGIPRAEHLHKVFVDDDLVPAEETGFTSLCIEDFLEGIVDCDMITAGSPCQDVSPANTEESLGIDGKKSRVIHDVMRVIEDLEPKYAVIENSSKLTSKGLDVILSKFYDLGYDAQWSIVSAANFGFNHYRHRCFIVAYLNETALAASGKQLFRTVSGYANKAPGETLSLLCNMSPAQREFTKVNDTKSIKLRSKRINALGNSIVVDVSQSILQSIADIEHGNGSLERMSEKVVGNVSERGVFCLEGLRFTNMPSAGIMKNGLLIQVSPDRSLNPSNSEFIGMAGTLLKKDGNNNYSGLSRLTRPGTLGGHVGSIMQEFGYRCGGLNPVYCEQLMGFSDNYTDAEGLAKGRMQTPMIS